MSPYNVSRQIDIRVFPKPREYKTNSSLTSDYLITGINSMHH